jgi:hypothetical protein
MLHLKIKKPNRFHLHPIKISTRINNNIVEIETDVRTFIRIYQDLKWKQGRKFPIDLEMFLNTVAKNYNYFEFDIKDKVTLKEVNFSNDI